jgi:hypothetical protein
MYDIFDVIALASICLSLTSIIVATFSIACIVGFKNSTHKIEWKPLEVAAVKDDLDEDLSMFENPLKRKPYEPFPPTEMQSEFEFANLDDPNEESHKF